SNKQDVPFTIATDGSGNILLTGYSEGPIDFGGGPLSQVLGSNAFVTKLDSSGAHVWSRGYGMSARGIGVAADALGNVLVTGSFWDSITIGPVTHPSAGADDI